MNGLRLKSGGFRHSLGCSARRCCQKNVHAFRFKESDDHINGGGFSGAGTSGQDKQAIFDTFLHRFQLQFIQFHGQIFRHAFQTFADRCILGGKIFCLHHRDIQIPEHIGTIQLRIVIRGSKYCFSLCHKLSVHDKVIHLRTDIFL